MARVEWWAGRDSNPRRLAPRGLQPRPFGHSGTCPGAHARNRTGDLFLTMETLCRLSYVGLADRPRRKRENRLAARKYQRKRASQYAVASLGGPDATLSSAMLGLDADDNRVSPWTCCWRRASGGDVSDGRAQQRSGSQCCSLFDSSDSEAIFSGNICRECPRAVSAGSYGRRTHVGQTALR